jgi:type II secretory pathway pseudopilin PulG
MDNYNVKSIPIQSMRAGWTMIELIFILVVVGILATIALPKLNAVRDDAKLSVDVSNMAICISDLGAIYTATHTNLTDINSSTCDQIVCFITERDTSRLRVDLNESAASYCADIENVGGHLVGTYEFAGTNIKR